MLWGWSPAEVCIPEYDDAGRVAQYRVEREPEFDADQRDLLIALADYEATLNELGIPIDEATSIDADPENAKGKYRYEVDTAIDWSVQARDLEQKARSGADDSYSRSRKYFVRRVERQ